ncbi:hypothetical protein HMPREF9220_0562 [Dialister micraerophilus UPII 345-E]|uniref:Uncharacterized protein n=1 Tax=Dialister micraerophilus UPII 345-E TaxID=910314 RepID=E4L906_9FIRM|nr:hypothetical protein HMPREF9220_0562 [Dialister micraerophilus UPII 345-E]
MNPWRSFLKHYKIFFEILKLPKLNNFIIPVSNVIFIYKNKIHIEASNALINLRQIFSSDTFLQSTDIS